jgi:hypothetical protein
VGQLGTHGSNFNDYFMLNGSVFDMTRHRARLRLPLPRQLEKRLQMFPDQVVERRPSRPPGVIERRCLGTGRR